MAFSKDQQNPAVSDNVAQGTAPTLENKQYDNTARNRTTGSNLGGTAFNWTDQSSVFGSGMDVMAIGTSLLTVEKALTNIIENRLPKTPEYSVELIPFDSKNHRELVCDVMVIAVKAKDTKIPVGMHPVLLTTSDVKLRTFESTFNNMKVTADLLPCQLFSGETVGFLTGRIEKHFGRDVAMAAGTVLFTDLVDLSSEETSLRVLVNSVEACVSAIRSSRDSKDLTTLLDLNIAENRNEQVLVVSTDMNNQNVVDEYEQPIRADFTVNVNARDISRNDDIAGTSVEKNYSLITGQIDLLPYFESTNETQSQYFRSRDTSNRKQFIPNIIFNSITMAGSNSIGNLLTALVTAVDTVSQNTWWASVLDPFNQPQDDVHSIAGLGHEVALVDNSIPFGPIPVNSEAYTKEHYMDFLDNYVIPNPSFSMRVPLAGPGTWKTSIFMRAAMESEAERLGEDSANAKILRHAEKLCDGHFLEIYKAMGGSGRVISTLPHRYALGGTYISSRNNGQERPLSDIDRMFLLNTVDGERSHMPMVEDWTTAQIDPMLDAIQRVGTFTEIAHRVAPSTKVTSYEAILDWEAIFLIALREAMMKVGFSVERRSTGGTRYMGVGSAVYLNNAIVTKLTGSVARASVVSNGRSTRF